MELTARIRRRLQADESGSPVLDEEALSPVAHRPEPIGRGPTIESLLDALDPVFEGDRPSDVSVWGPPGGGKSAVVTAVFAELSAVSSQARGAIPTTTRTRPPELPRFVYLDARRTASAFELVRAILLATTDERVPERGVGTAALRSRLAARFDADGPGLVIALDHVGEPETPDRETLAARLGPIRDATTTVAIERDDPTSRGQAPGQVVAVQPYRRHALVDVLSDRASTGLAGQPLGYEPLRDVAEWAEGDAHDALAALLAAADRASADGRSRVVEADLQAGMESVPQPGRSLGRVMALSANRQRVLRRLVALDDAARSTVSDAAEAIVAGEDVTLTTGTVERYLYELAECGILARRRRDREGLGRPPSRIEPRFPTAAFCRLHDRER